MNTKARIASIFQAETLSEKITGFPVFSLKQLQCDENMNLELPIRMRLGHMVERIVEELLKGSSNFKVLHENVQIIENKRTIGEIDFILQETETQKVIHMEFAYKFYLFDPKISNDSINNWIGPNRNDSLIEKLQKLKERQFPILYTPQVKEQLFEIHHEIQQELCLLTSLYIPYQYKHDFAPEYKKAIKGYYMHWTEFKDLDHSQIQYYIPDKKEWGIDPSENSIWFNYKAIQDQIHLRTQKKQSPMVWSKREELYEVFFVTWWN